MFEREFEFVVPQSFESSLGRIEAMKMSGCLSAFFKPMKHRITLRGDSYAEFVLQQGLGRNSGKAVLEGKVEKLDEEATKISGLVRLDGVIFILIMFNLIALAFVIQDIQSGNWWFLGLTLIWYPLAMYQFIYYRNRLIEILQKVLE